MRLLVVELTASGDAGTWTRDTHNDADDTFGRSGGQMTLAPRAVGDGYMATFEIGVAPA